MNIYHILYKIKSIPRNARFKLQRITRGFNDMEIWNLNDYLIEYIYPRLRAFYDADRHAYPVNLTWKKWNAILAQMVLGFEIEILVELADDFTTNMTDEELKELFNARDWGMKMFGKFLLNLWD